MIDESNKYQCIVCSYSTPYKANLKTHFKSQRHVNNQPQPPLQPQVMYPNLMKVYNRVLKIEKVQVSVPEVSEHVIVNVRDPENRYLDLFQLLNGVDNVIIQPIPGFDPTDWIETYPIQYDLCVFGDLTKEFWQVFLDNNLDAKIHRKIPYQASHINEESQCSMDEPFTSAFMGLLKYEAVKVHIKIESTLDEEFHTGSDCLPVGDAYCDIPMGTIIKTTYCREKKCNGEFTINNPLPNTQWSFHKFKFPIDNKRYSIIFYRPELRAKIARCRVGDVVNRDWFSDFKECH